MAFWVKTPETSGAFASPPVVAEPRVSELPPFPPEPESELEAPSPSTRASDLRSEVEAVEVLPDEDDWEEPPSRLGEVGEGVGARAVAERVAF